MTIRWHWHGWHELTADALYALLRLRSDIFVVEQNCVFPDMDGIDPQCEHLCGHAPDGRLLAYLRLVPPGVKAPQPALGRLVVHAEARGEGLGRAAIVEGLRRSRALYPNQGIFISGQQHLEKFYASLGFSAIGAPYLEDGILHQNMLLSA